MKNEQNNILVFDNVDKHGTYTNLYGFIGGYNQKDIEAAIENAAATGKTNVRPMSFAEFSEVQKKEGGLRFTTNRALPISERAYKKHITNPHQEISITKNISGIKILKTLGFGLYEYFLYTKINNRYKYFKIIKQDGIQAKKLQSMIAKSIREYDVT